jgi:hypothetical protein
MAAVPLRRFTRGYMQRRSPRHESVEILSRRTAAHEALPNE